MSSTQVPFRFRGGVWQLTQFHLPGWNSSASPPCRWQVNQDSELKSNSSVLHLVETATPSKASLVVFLDRKAEDGPPPLQGEMWHCCLSWRVPCPARKNPGAPSVNYRTLSFPGVATFYQRNGSQNIILIDAGCHYRHYSRNHEENTYCWNSWFRLEQTPEPASTNPSRHNSTDLAQLFPQALV